MGKQDSSKTRVVPVFDALMKLDPIGKTWLQQLCQMGSRSATCMGSATVGTLRPGHPRNELHLDPPKALLQWLVRNVESPTSDDPWGGDATKSKREALVSRDPATVTEAIRLLDESCKGPAWYILEGRSQPDAFLETDATILVIEGKRTEREATSATTWMRGRSQLLRHMDAAWEIRDGKRVLGLMITGGAGGADAIAPSEHWIKQAELVVSDYVLASSLPHRSEADRKELTNGFLGVTTWQRLCRDFRLPWPPAEDEQQ